MIEAIVALTITLFALCAVLVLQEARFKALLMEQAKERADLLQRIQAPEQAVMTHAVGDFDPVVPVAFDDDDDAYEAKELLNG